MLTYEDLFSLAAEAKRKILNKTLLRFELIKPRTFQLLFDSIPLLLSLHPKEVYFFLSSNVKGAQLDPFSNYFHKRLQGHMCTDLSLLNQDRVLELKFSNGYRLVALLFSKKPNLYLVNQTNGIESSLYPVKEPFFTLPQKPQRKSFSPPSNLTSAQLEFQMEKEEHLKQVKYALAKGENHLKQLFLELQRCKGWEKVQHEGILLQSNFHLLKKGMSSLTIEDWQSNQPVTLLLDPKGSPLENVAARFQSAKRLHSGVKKVEEALQKQTAKVEGLKIKLTALQKAQTLEDLPQTTFPQQAKSLSKPQKGLPYKEFFSERGLPIWVGKGAAKNALLTFKYAKGSDWWLHVQGYPGSHVVIRTEKNCAPDEETLQDALTLAIEHSKAKGEKTVEVLVTQRKYVARLGKVGQVQVSRHKLIQASFDQNRLLRLSKNPNKKGEQNA